MSKKRVTINCDKEKAESLYQQLGKLQAWCSGWNAAGKLGPPGSEAVWQLRQLLIDAKETK